VPEFNLGLGIIVFAALCAATLIIRTRRRVVTCKQSHFQAFDEASGLLEQYVNLV